MRRRYTPHQMLYTRLQAGAPRPMATLLREVNRCIIYSDDAEQEAHMIDAAINVFVLGTRAAHTYRVAQERDIRVMREWHSDRRAGFHAYSSAFADVSRELSK